MLRQLAKECSVTVAHQNNDEHENKVNDALPNLENQIKWKQSVKQRVNCFA